MEATVTETLRLHRRYRSVAAWFYLVVWLCVLPFQYQTGRFCTQTGAVNWSGLSVRLQADPCPVNAAHKATASCCKLRTQTTEKVTPQSTPEQLKSSCCCLNLSAPTPDAHTPTDAISHALVCPALAPDAHEPFGRLPVWWLRVNPFEHIGRLLHDFDPTRTLPLHLATSGVEVCLRLSCIRN